MKCPAEVYAPSLRAYCGLPNLRYPFHDREIVVTACGRLCLHRKKINISSVLAGQTLGIKEVDVCILSMTAHLLGRAELSITRSP